MNNHTVSDHTSVYSRSRADEIVAALSSDPEDDWEYTVQDVTKEYSVIRVTDENGDFVAYANF